MLDRNEVIQTFLRAAGWQECQLQRIAGDMSPRRYSRLTLGGRTAILMDADQDMTAFIDMTYWLRGLTLSVPEILAENATDGLILLEDFGDTSMKAAVEGDPSLEGDAFGYCVEILLRIRNAQPPSLLQPDAQELVAWTKLADEHMQGVNPRGLEGFRSILEGALTSVLSKTPTVSLRDFHSENLMWLPDRESFRKLGLLDYQDAFLTHYAYDLVSLLTDARSWVPKSLRRSVIQSYLAATEDEPTEFELAFAVLSAQRNLRILGIFARAKRHGEYMRNTFRYFSEALEHPVFAPVRRETLQAFPSELVDL